MSTNPAKAMFRSLTDSNFALVAKIVSERRKVQVPSRSGNHSHYVNLETMRCSCPDFHFRKAICFHIRVARVADWMKVSVETVLANIEQGKQRWNCKLNASCSFCCEGKDYHPGKASYLDEVAIAINQQIQSA